jgi:hypothetical protein
MNVKIRLFETTLLWAVCLLAVPAFAFELECGEYELVGRYDSKKQTFWLYEGTDSRTPFRLYGIKTLTGFLAGDRRHYRIKVAIHQTIPDQGGRAELLDVLELAQYEPKKLQFKKLSSKSCQ